MAKTNLKKNSKGYGYQYTDLAQIHEALEEMGITYYQYIETQDGDDYIYTVLIEDGTEKPPRRGCKVIETSPGGKSNPAQAYGSGLTYARRYSLLMACGFATTDDDAQTLDGATKKNTTKAKKSVRSENKASQTYADGLATDEQKKAFVMKCKKAGADFMEIAKQAGWTEGAMTSDLLEKCEIILEERNEQ